MNLELTTKLHLGNALALARVSAAAYSKATFQSSRAHVLDIHDGRAGARVLAFRGTACAADFVVDAEVRMSNVGDGLAAHHGFYGAINSIAGDLIERAAWAKRIPLFVTGHSLGGALAILGAKILKGAGFFVQGVYTFGCPRVGNKRFAETYDCVLGDRTYCFENEEDVVTRVPGWLSGYRKCRTVVFFPSGFGVQGSEGRGQRSEGFIVNPGLVTKVRSNAAGAWKDFWRGRPSMLSDHGIEHYVKRLEGMQSPESKALSPKSEHRTSNIQKGVA